MKKDKKKDTIYFTETLPVNRFWIRIFLLAEIIFFAAVIYRQLFMGKPFGPYPVTNGGLLLLSLLFISPVAVLFFIKMKIEVRPSGIDYKMIPAGLFRYRIPPEKLKSFSVETRKTRKGHETQGLFLRLKNGKNLFLPSHRPDDFFEAVRKMTTHHP